MTIDTMKTVIYTFLERGTKSKNEANWLVKKKPAIPKPILIIISKNSKIFFQILYFQGFDL